MKRLARILLVLGVLASTTLGCTINLGGPALPVDTIAVSPDAAAQAKQEFKAAVENAGSAGGSVTFELPEVQLTSLLAERLAGQTDPILSDPQVYLRDGQIKIYGKAQRGLFAATVGIIVSAGVDPDGKPSLTLVSADFGPLPAPQGLGNAITDLVNEAYTSALGPVATGFRMESLSVQDGSVTLTGHVR
jgi:hypothetical protein